MQCVLNLKTNILSISRDLRNVGSDQANKRKGIAGFAGKDRCFSAESPNRSAGETAGTLTTYCYKSERAIKEVAKENKYTFIVNAVEDILLYSEPADDVLPLVKKKLGIQ